jgi:hypothetical protein
MVTDPGYQRLKTGHFFGKNCTRAGKATAADDLPPRRRFDAAAAISVLFMSLGPNSLSKHPTDSPAPSKGE